MRDIYVNGLNTADFPGLKNLKSVNVWTWNVLVDIHFNETKTDESLNEIVDILKNSKNIQTVGYTSNKRISVRLDNKFYDAYKAGTLILDDILDNKIENSNNFSIKIHDFIPIAIITLEMEDHGSEHAKSMIEQLKELNFPFINNEDLNFYN